MKFSKCFIDYCNSSDLFQRLKKCNFCGRDIPYWRKFIPFIKLNRTHNLYYCCIYHAERDLLRLDFDDIPYTNFVLSDSILKLLKEKGKKKDKIKR